MFPSLEAFEEGINYPLVYMIFYEYFFKSSVGDSAWKKACLEAKDPTEPMAAPQEEAFAMILLRNNYFAWLWEAKTEFDGLLVTEYDSPTGERASKFEDFGFTLVGRRINLDANVDEEDIDKILVPSTKFKDGVEHGDENPLFDTLLRNNCEMLKTIWGKAAENTKYMDLKQTSQIGASPSTDQESSPEQTVNMGTKKRKRLRSLREYTCGNDEDSKFKGWSYRASEDMGAYIATLDSTPAKYKVFRRAYRVTYLKRLSESGKKKKPNEQPVPVNYSTNVWGLGDIPDVDV